ncbi:MAG TPA: hypothetical protein VMM58_07215, partial [Bacteroidota bacterium]|nr:hypothetical protein [Bacteroidota bacterium]
MKKVIFMLGFLLPIFLQAQEAHVYGPVMDTNYNAWRQTGTQTPVNLGTSYGHDVGMEISENWEFRTISYWAWNYSDIPVQATVTSVRIKFRAHNPDGDNFEFSFHNISHMYNESGVNFFNQCVSTNQIDDVTLTADQNKYYYFDKTYTRGDPLFTAVSDAITSGNYYFTLGIKEIGSSMPPDYYQLLPYDGGDDNTVPVVDLTINYTTPDQYYQLSNVIQSTTNYGHLIANNDTINQIASGTQKFFSWGTTNNVRSAELPFLANWNNGGTTQKHDYWYLPTVPATKYFIYDTIVAVSQTSSIHNATFDQTSLATVGVSWDLGSVSDSIEFRDPWRYYRDASSKWAASNQFIKYAAPFTTTNNNSTSYGGVFLGKNPQTSPLYYSVRAPLTKTVNGNVTSFINWTVTGATFYDGGANGGNDSAAVVFSSSGATVTANYKAHLATTSTAALSNNNQRKIVRDILGNYHCVYESGGKIFYYSGAAGGTTWYNEVYLSGGADVSGWSSKNPVIDIYQSGSNYYPVV